MAQAEPHPAKHTDAASGRILHIERRIGGSPEAVFDAWITPEILARWWGPEGFTVPEQSHDLRVGGTWRTVMLSPQGERHIVSGVYREISRPRRLAFTWAWDQDDGSRGHETLVTIELSAKGEGTLLKLTQAEFAETEHRDNHRLGWDSSLNDLQRIFG